MHTIQPSDTNRPFAAPTQPGRGKPLAAAIVSLALLAAGCGASSPNNSNTGSPASFTAAAFKYSSCMRDHGLSSFPDPTMTDHDGRQVAYLTATIPVDPSPAFKSAQNACRGVLPPPINSSPTQLAQQRRTREQHNLAFAKCLSYPRHPRLPRSRQPRTANPRDGQRGGSRSTRTDRPDCRQGLPRDHRRGDHRSRRATPPPRHPMKIPHVTDASRTEQGSANTPTALSATDTERRMCVAPTLASIRDECDRALPTGRGAERLGGRAALAYPLWLLRDSEGTFEGLGPASGRTGRGGLAAAGSVAPARVRVSEVADPHPISMPVPLEA